VALAEPLATEFGLPLASVILAVMVWGPSAVPARSCTEHVPAVQLRAGTADGPQTITAKITDANGNPNSLASGSASATLYQYSLPLSMAVSFAGGINRIAPNGVATTTAMATLTDAGGQPVPGQAVSFATDATTNPVTFSAFHDNGNGTYTKVVTAPAVVAPATQRTTQTITATATAWSVSASAPLTIGYPSLHTSGNAIYDDFNRRVTLQGADAIYTGASVQPQAAYPDNLNHLGPGRSGTPNWVWGFNTVRLALSDAYWFSSASYDSSGTPCSTGYRQQVTDVVNQVTSRGMIALLTLQQVPAASTQTDVPPGALECSTAITGPGHKALRAMADAAYAPAFWSDVAATFKDNPMVAFELYNEPVVIHDIWSSAGPQPGTQPCKDATVQTAADATSIWHDGGQVLDSTGAYTAAGMQTLYNHVRAAGASNLTLVGGIGPAACNESGAYNVSVALTNPVVDGSGSPAPNVVYSSHPYYGTNCGVGSTGVPPDLDSIVGNTAQSYPVVFSEFGSFCLATGGAQQFNQEVIDYAVAHGLGWINYRFNRDWPDFDGLGKQEADFGLYQCDPTYSAGCSTTTKTYEYYEPRDRGMPAYTQLGKTPNRLN